MRRFLSIHGRVTRPSRVGRFAPSLLMALALCFFLPAVAFADLKLDVRTDRTSMSLDDSLTLQVTVQSQGTDQPRIDLPEFDGFQVLSQQVQRPMQFSFSFGSRAMIQSQTIYLFVLQPTRQGKITIKPVRAELDGAVKTSRPVEITVAGGAGSVPGTSNTPNDSTAQGNAAAGAQTGQGNTLDSAQVDSIAFLRTVADKAEPFEGEQVTITIYLYVRERLQSTPNIATEPTTEGLWVHDLLPPSRQLQPQRQMVGDEIYTVYVLRRFAAFPLRNGDVTIGPMAVEISTASVMDIFAPDRARPNIKRTGSPLVLHVKPLPEQNKPAGEVAVGRFKLNAKLDRNQAMAGDALTLTAVVQGEGNIRTVQVAPPKLPNADVLQPEVKDLVEAPNDLLTGTREYRWLIVPHDPGHLTIPPLTLASFDPRSQTYSQVQSNALALDVVGQAAARGAAPAPAQPSAVAPDGQDQDHEAHKWAPIRTQSELQRSYARFAERPIYPWLLALPGLCWLAVVSTSLVRRRIAARGETVAGRAMREAGQRLTAADAAANDGDAARFHSAASAALIAVLDARMGEPVSGFTRAQLRDHLVARGMDAKGAADVTAALERHEFARFGSGASVAELASQHAMLHMLFERIAEFTPRGAEDAA